MCAALFFCPFSGEVLIPLLRSPSSASDGPSGEAAGIEANKRRLTLDLASTLQRWLKVWRSRASACAGAVKPPSTGRPTKGEADNPLLGSAIRHSQHALGAPSGRYAVRPRLRARGFSRRAGRQGQSGPTGLPGCLARARSKSLPRRLSHVRLERLPSSAGISPLKALVRRSSVTRPSSLVVTYRHSPRGASLSQLSLSYRVAGGPSLPMTCCHSREASGTDIVSHRPNATACPCQSRVCEPHALSGVLIIFPCLSYPYVTVST